MGKEPFPNSPDADPAVYKPGAELGNLEALEGGSGLLILSRPAPAYKEDDWGKLINISLICKRLLTSERGGY